MPRKSKIEQLGIGDKVVGYSISGMTNRQIINRIATEHSGARLTEPLLCRYLQRRSALISQRKGVSQDNAITFTLDSIKAELLKTIDEIRAYIEKWPDNPKAGAAGLKLKLDALEKMTRMLGGYAPESQVNVAVNVAQKSVSDQVKEFEGYFKSLEAKKSAEVHESPTSKIENPHLNNTIPVEIRDASTNP